MTSFLRITLLIALVFVAYKLYPRFKPVIQPALANPQILGAQVATPVIDTVNKILPNNLRIPTLSPQKDTPTGSNQSSSNTNSTNNQSTNSSSNNTPTIPPLNNIINDVKQKAGEAAQNQIDTVKKETSNAFCTALIETIKKQCGVQ